MDPSVAVGASWQEVALELESEVASVGGVFAGEVIEARQLIGQLGVGSSSDEPGVHGVLEGEAALELSELHPELLPVLPLCPGIDDARAIDAAGVAVDLHLQLEGEVAQACVHVQSHESQPQVCLGFGVVAGGAIDLGDDVSAEGGVLLQLLDKGAVPLRFLVREGGSLLCREG